MKKIILSLVLFSATTLTVLSQYYQGFENDNFNGLHGVLINPANIVDSRIKSEINIFSTQIQIGTDYTPLTPDNFINIINEDSFTVFPKDDNELLLNLELFGPSFMFNLTKKSSIGLLSRVRIYNNSRNLNAKLYEDLTSGFDDEDFDFNMKNLDQTLHAWGEIGLTYGRILTDKDNNFLKAGITLKYLLGGGVVQATSNSFSGDYVYNENDPPQSLINLSGDLSYMMSYNEDEDPFSSITPGFGTDIGLIYEYRPESTRTIAEDRNGKGFNKYKLKIGVAILDIGHITYKDQEQTDYTLNGSVTAEEGENDIGQALEDNYPGTTTVKDIKVSLPTALQINIDYRITHRVYASVNYNTSLLEADKPYNNIGQNILSISPRYETRFFSLYLPVSFSELGGTAIGTGFRLGPLVIGSGTILSTLFSDNAKSANIYAGLKVPIYQKRKSKLENDTLTPGTVN
ncbi:MULTISPECIES: DUF5723 family protein [Arenibacter]|uniref:DUF5723 family protein n=1 Tax=Arenibacter TaxID=178469 RepID=UPI00068EDD63|nr:MULTISPECIES: DUF5723 family protein [Arenibacter]GBF20932.1 hypothetical protein C21_03109 [Arenibacter sp. NBRC 103722]